MAGLALLNDLDLASLLCSRVCHDVISPVGAIANGLEVLEDEDDAEMRKIAFELVNKSAKQASAKLQFCRIAFGAAGSAGAHIDLGEAGDVSRMFVGDEKIELDWQAPRETRSKIIVKLLLNMLLMGMSSIPRGGKVSVDLVNERLIVTATGTGAKVAEKTTALLNGEMTGEDLDARLVQVYYAQRLASEANYNLRATLDGETATISADPIAG